MLQGRKLGLPTITKPKDNSPNGVTVQKIQNHDFGSVVWYHKGIILMKFSPHHLFNSPRMYMKKYSTDEEVKVVAEFSE